MASSKTLRLWNGSGTLIATTTSGETVDAWNTSSTLNVSSLTIAAGTYTVIYFGCYNWISFSEYSEEIEPLLVEEQDDDDEVVPTVSRRRTREEEQEELEAITGKIFKKKTKATKAKRKETVAKVQDGSKGKQLKADKQAYLNTLKKQPTDNRKVKYVVHQPGKKADGTSGVIFPTKTSAMGFVTRYTDKYGGLTVKRYSKNKKTGNVTIGRKKVDTTNRQPSAYQKYVAYAWTTSEVKDKYNIRKSQVGRVKALEDASKYIAAGWKQSNMYQPPKQKASSGSGLSMKAKWTIAKKNPEQYMKTGKTGKQVWDTAKVMKITK